MKTKFILALLLCGTGLFFGGCVTDSVTSPSLGGIGAAVAVIGDRVDDAQVNAKDVSKLADTAYSKGITAKSAEATALKNKVQELQGNLVASQQAIKSAYAAKDSAQAEVNKVAKEAAKVPELQKAVAGRNKWMILIIWITAGVFLLGYYATKLFAFTGSLAGPWGVAVGFLTKLLPVEVLGGLAAVLAWSIVCTILLTIWSGFGWLFGLFG